LLGGTGKAEDAKSAGRRNYPEAVPNGKGGNGANASTQVSSAWAGSAISGRVDQLVILITSPSLANVASFVWQFHRYLVTCLCSIRFIPLNDVDLNQEKRAKAPLLGASLSWLGDSQVAKYINR
jgi:hypothetical protein